MTARRCENHACGRPFEARTRRARYCRPACRAAAWKNRTNYGTRPAIKEIQPCRPTTSATTSQSAAANGDASPNSPSNFTIKPLPPIATRRQSFSSASSRPAPTGRPITLLAPITTRTLSFAPRADAEHELLEISQQLEARRATRDRRGGTGRTFRCPGCNLFTRNPRARCRHCGYDPDTGWPR